MMTSPSTRAWALVAGMPMRRPARRAVSSAANTTRFLPSRPTRTSGVLGGGAVSPNVLLTRSVDQVGRKSETTLGIASLHFEIGTPACATADEFQLPAGASNARHRQGSRGQRGNPPSGDGGGRLSEVGGLGR